jgi:hypothetical protein
MADREVKLEPKKPGTGKESSKKRVKGEPVTNNPFMRPYTPREGDMGDAEYIAFPPGSRFNDIRMDAGTVRRINGGESPISGRGPIKSSPFSVPAYKPGTKKLQFVPTKPKTGILPANIVKSLPTIKPMIDTATKPATKNQNAVKQQIVPAIATKTKPAVKQIITPVNQIPVNEIKADIKMLLKLRTPVPYLPDQEVKKKAAKPHKEDEWRVEHSKKIINTHRMIENRLANLHSFIG